MSYYTTLFPCIHNVAKIKLGWMDCLVSHMPTLCAILEQHKSQATTPSRSFSVVQSTRLTASSLSTGSTAVTLQLSRQSLPSNAQPEKRAASVTNTVQGVELSLSAVPKAVLRSLGADPLLHLELPLLQSVDKLIESIPTGWKKVT